MGARRSRVPVAMTVLLVVVLGATVWWGVTHLGFFSLPRHGVFVTWTLIAWAIFAAAVVSLRFVPGRRAEILVVVGALIVGVASLAGPPNTSTDSARYAWDGIVQLHGISPYAHAPASHALAALRPEWLFPAPTDVHGVARCLGTRIMTAHDTTTHDLLCTAINRPRVQTIYPPMAELWFAGIRSLVPTAATYWPMQVAGLLVSLGITVGLLAVLRRSGRPPWWAALWGWCPLVAAEAVTNSHVDVLGAALATAGAVLVAWRRPVIGGIALGAATAVKLIPALVYAPLLGRRRHWLAVAAGVAVFALLYVPYVITTGTKVVGYLPGYLSEEGYDDGTRYALVSLAFGGDAATVAVIVLGIVALVVAVRLTDPARPWSGEVFFIGVVFLILTPRYPWYALLLVPFVVLSGRWEWLSIGLAMTLRQLNPSLHAYRDSLGVAIAIILIVTIARTPRDEWLRWAGRLLGARLAGAPAASSGRTGLSRRVER